MNDPDARLVEQARDGDERAFGRLVKKYRDRVLYLAYDLTGNYSDAEDIAQEAFLKAFRGISGFRGGSQFSTWLFRIVTNAALDLMKRQKSRPTVPLDERREEVESTTVQGPAALRELSKQDLWLQVIRALEKASGQQRAAFLLRYKWEMKIETIAEILSCSPPTARVHLFRATEKVRKAMSARPDDQT